MKITRVNDSFVGSELAARLFMDLHAVSPTQPLGLATGLTMTGVYQALARHYFRPQCSDVFLLDEYLDLPDGHQNTFEQEIRHQFCDPLSYDGNVHVPGRGPYTGPKGPDLFEQRLEELGPVSAQLLGVGTNGHVAFNEPGSELDSTTREVALSDETIESNKRQFRVPEEMPHRAVTQGLATISQAEALIVLAFGPAKKAALVDALREESKENPLSLILRHPQLTIITDIDTR